MTPYGLINSLRSSDKYMRQWSHHHHFRAMRSLWYPISRLRDFTRSCGIAVRSPSAWSIETLSGTHEHFFLVSVPKNLVVCFKFGLTHYVDVIMTTVASPITSLAVVYATVYSGAHEQKPKTSELRVTGLCAGNSPGPVNSPHKWPVTRKMFPFDDVIMRKFTMYMVENTLSCNMRYVFTAQKCTFVEI